MREEDITEYFRINDNLITYHAMLHDNLIKLHELYGLDICAANQALIDFAIAMTSILLKNKDFKNKSKGDIEKFIRKMMDKAKQKRNNPEDIQ